jgi:hypothetical protein
MADPREVAWPFHQPRNTAVVCCEHVLEQGAPIRVVTHDADDGGWQFLCRSEHSVTDGRVVGLGEIVGLDSSLLQLADLPEGWTAIRAEIGWRREPVDGQE